MCQHLQLLSEHLEQRRKYIEEFPGWSSELQIVSGLYYQDNEGHDLQ